MTRGAVLAVMLLTSCTSGFAGDRPGALYLFGECPDGTETWISASRRFTIWDEGNEIVLASGPEFCGDIRARVGGRVAQMERKSCEIASDPTRRLVGGTMDLIDTDSQMLRLVIAGYIERDVAITGFPVQVCTLHLVGLRNQ